MQKIRLSVKGTEQDARGAMASRGIAAPELAGESGGRTFWDVLPNHRAAVVSWFCEPSECAEGAGFPAGTLLHHG